MTEPGPTRPRPGPSRPGPAAASSPEEPVQTSGDVRSGETSAEDLAQRPVAEHVGVFEAEHARLQRELGTIDQL